MTTSLQTDPRRAARDAVRKPPRRSLEMPVLFQLADLSLPRTKAAPPSVPAYLELPSTPTAEPSTAAVAITPPLVTAPPDVVDEPVVAPDPIKVETPVIETPEVASAIVESPKLEAPPAEPQPELAALQAEVVAPPAEAAQIAVTADPEEKAPAAETVASVAAVSLEPSPIDTTPPAEATAPSPRERAEQRAKNRKPIPGDNDWMRTHGKFIAVGFVIALIATIYLAQNGDEPAPANPNAAAATGEESKTSQPTGESESTVTDAHTAKESMPIAEHSHSPTLLIESNPAEGHLSADAHAELQPPKVDNAVKEPAEASDVADAKSLFPWKDTGESRIASKPEDVSSKLQMNPHVTAPKAEVKEETPAEEPPAEEAPSLYGPPSSRKQEPSTTQPASLGQQVSPAADYPVTSQNNYREFEPPQNRPATAQPRVSPQATPASYQPGTSNNVPPTRTSGPRNERTGSGLY
ncbi:MAG: hypothetical protein ACKVP0_02580 [Pirellulaceae bacterium]